MSNSITILNNTPPTISAASYIIDKTAPTVTQAATDPTTGDLNAGAVITISLAMNEPVTVTGTPTLTLNDGGVATYVSGSGASTLVFKTTVAAGQNTPALAITGSNLNGGAITDLAGNPASLAGANVTFSGLAIGATVQSVAANFPSTATVGPGAKVIFTVTTSEPVSISGAPFLTLNDGGKATYTSGSGTKSLTFTYTVGATGSAQNTPSLAVTGFSANGATVYNSGNKADTADLSGVTMFTSGPQVDTTAPAVVSVAANPSDGDLDAGNTVLLTATFTAPVFVTGTPTLKLNDGGTASYVSGSGSNALTFSCTVAAGQNTADLTVTGSSVTGASITDAVGNKATLSGLVTNPAGVLKIDTTAPTVKSVTANPANGDLNAGKTVTLTVNLSEAVTISGGTPILSLNDGGTATYQGGSGSTALTFTYTIQPGQNIADLAVTGSSLGGATILDAAGNAADLSGAVTNPSGTLQIDTTAPTLLSVSATPASAATGATVAITFNLSEAVKVTGSPILVLNDGGTATYASGSGTSSLTFNYKVPSNQGTTNLAITGIELPTASSILDLAGNAAVLYGPSETAATTPLGVTVNSIVTGASSITVSGSQVAEIFGPSNQNVIFAVGASGTLQLDAASGYTGNVSGLTQNDTIDLASLAYGPNMTVGYNGNAAGGILTVSNGTQSAAIALLGNYTASTFTPSSNGQGGTNVVDPPKIAAPLMATPLHA